MKTSTLKKTSSRSGFTLVEILIVLVLLGLIFSILGRKVFSGLSRGKIQATKIMIKQLEGDLDRYRLDCNQYPKAPNGPGLKALVEAPGDGVCKNWDPNGYRGGEKKMPSDSWNNEFQYVCEDGTHYVIKSLGADGVEGGDGENADISSEDENK